MKTMALVEACYLSAREHRAVEIREIERPGVPLGDRAEITCAISKCRTAC